MKNKYKDLIEQTFDFPQDEFSVEDNELNLYDIPLMEIIKQYGTPLKVTYLPKISRRSHVPAHVQRGHGEVDYKGRLQLPHCTKSIYFSFVLEEALQNDIHLETVGLRHPQLSSTPSTTAGSSTSDRYIICNGFKRPQYVENIARLVDDGFGKHHPRDRQQGGGRTCWTPFEKKCKVGIRIACEEEPKFDFC